MILNFKEFLCILENAAITAAPDNAIHPGTSQNPVTPVMQHPYNSLGVFATQPTQGKVFNMKTKGKNVCFNIDGQAGACIPEKMWIKNPFRNGDRIAIDYFAHPREAQKGKATRDIAKISIIQRSAGG